MFGMFIIQFLLYGCASAFGYFFGFRKNIDGKTDISGSAIVGMVGGGMIATSTLAIEYLESSHFPKDSIVPVAAPFAIFLAAIIILYMTAGYRAKKLGADAIVVKKISEKTMSAPILIVIILAILSLLGI